MGGFAPDQPVPVRPEVLASWQRSLAAGVGAVCPPYIANFDTDSRFMRAARPVVDDLQQRLAGTSACIFLTDESSLILERRLADSPVGRRLARIASEPGFWFSEEVVGTNGCAIVVDGGGPNFILGAEHFPGELHDLSCFAAPVRDRVTGRLAGVVDITCAYRDTNDLIMPIVLRAAEDIAARLGADTTRTERLMVEAFSRATRRSSRPVVAVNDSMTISNRAAARLLGSLDQGRLWDEAAAALRGTGARASWLTLAGVVSLTAKCRPIRDSGTLVGAVVYLREAGGCADQAPVRTAERGRSTIQRAEVEAITAALRDTRGGRGAAAELLGISRSTLYRKVKAYRLDPERFRSSPISD
jgi:transcriptional regulator of acetoin/glycerol metabolism